jgi:hypothetical protein
MANRRPPWDIPDVIDPPNRRCIQIEIPDDPQHIAIFWGVLRSLSDWQHWEREPLHRGTQVAQVWRKVVYAIDWSNMACCPDPTNQYYDENGVLQVSYDGGATYEPDASDPRLNSPLMPELPGDPGDVKRCTAANNVTGYVKSASDQLIADGTAWNNITTLLAAIGAIIVLLLSIGTAGALTPLLLGLVAALVGTGLAAFTAAMTEGVWSELACIIYCHTPNDAIYTEADWQAIKADIASQFDGIVEKFIYDTINAMGLAGLNNASRAGVHAGQPCECGCSNCSNLNEWEVIYGTVLEQTPGYMRLAAGAAGGGFTAIRLANYTTPASGKCCSVTYNLISGVHQTGSYTLCDGTVINATMPQSTCAYDFAMTNIFGGAFEMEFTFSECP